MTLNDVIQCTFYVLALLAVTKPLGWYMAKIYEGETPGPAKWLKPFETLFYRVLSINAKQDMSWKTYASSVLWFSFFGWLFLYALQRLQSFLPLNPVGQGAVAPDLAFNTAMSFVTNTNWQSYGGETTLSYLTQMAGLTKQNFSSAATGMAVLIAVIRGIRAKQGQGLGNFWVDLWRTILYILFPIVLGLAFVFVWQGMPQTFKPNVTVSLVQGTSYSQPVTNAQGQAVTDAKGQPETTSIPVTTQSLAIGPVASQIPIKQLGTNGGGFFNVNSAHPYENPSLLTSFLEMFVLAIIGSGLCFTFGSMVGDRRQGWALWAAMTLIFIPCMAACVSFEQSGNPAFNKMGIDQAASPTQSGGNMEGKEVRAGIASSGIWAVATTGTSCGSVVSMHDSFTPLGGLMPLFMLKLGCVVYGGVGAGLYGMLLYVLIAVFIAGLMVGRTPEYLGKKIEAYEMKMVSIAVLMPAFFVLIGTAISVLAPSGLAGLENPGAHGFTEALYAFASAGANNGSAFAGLTASTPFWDTLLGLTMFFGRFGMLVPILALAGSLAAKKAVPPGAGTLPTHRPLFIFFLVSVAIIVGALTYFPSWSLGPIVEHFQMIGGPK